MHCWVQEHLLREFLEFVVQVAGVHRPEDPRCRPCYGAVWLDKGRLEERCWTTIRGLLDGTGTRSRTWMGFSWPSEGGAEVRCELQLDDGYDGVNVRLEAGSELGELVRQGATRFH